MPPPPPPATPAVKAAKDRGPVSDNGLAKQVPDHKSTPTTSARPTIKLKIGGGTHGNGPVNGASAKTPSKPKKPPVESVPSKPPPRPKPDVKKEPKVPVRPKTNGVSHHNNNNKIGRAHV